MVRKRQRPRRSEGKRGTRSRRQRGQGKWLYVVLPMAALLIGLGGVWLLTRPSGAEVQLASVTQLPVKVRTSPPVVQEAYRFAIANPEVLTKLPCYCGCGAMGHMSNLDCYIQRFNADGSIVFDDHALG